MALIDCKECGKSISDKAAACPQCGCPVSGKVITLSNNPLNSEASLDVSQPQANESNSGGCAPVIFGIAAIAIGVLILLAAIKVFNFIIGAVGGLIVFVGLALMGLAS